MHYTWSRKWQSTKMSCLENPMDIEAWLAAVHGVTRSQTRLSGFTFTFHFHALEKEMATHSSDLALRIPGTGEPGGLPSMGLHRVGHDWSDLAAACCPLRFQGSPQTHQWECFLVFENLSFLRLPSQDRSPSLPLLSLFLSFISFPISFRRQWAAFLGTWCPRQHSEVVLWNLLSIQMFFWWICGGESGLSVLFFCHLRTTPQTF